MAKLEVNVGTGPDTHDGDSLRIAFNKVNTNFTELYDGVYTKFATIDSPTATGTQGEWYFDDLYLYLCVDTDTWKKVTLETWSVT